MSGEHTNLFQLASQRLQWLSDRQRVVSQNIANADVAEFKARDVESFESYLERAQITKSLPSAEVFETKTHWGGDVTGNTVVLEEQMLNARSTAGDYNVAASLYRKAHDMVLTVAGRR